MMGTEIFKIDASWAEKLTKTRVSFLSAPTVTISIPFSSIHFHNSYKAKSCAIQSLPMLHLHSLLFPEKMQQNDNCSSVVILFCVVRFCGRSEKVNRMTYCIGIGNIASQKHHTADTFSEVIIGRCRKPDQLCSSKVTSIALEYVQYER